MKNTCYFILWGIIFASHATGNERKPAIGKQTAQAKLQEWKYGDRHFERTIKRFVELTEAMADDKWRFSLVDSRNKRMHAIMSWGNGVGHDGKIRSYMYRPFNIRSSIHTVVLHVKGTYPTARGISFETFRQDAKDSWAVRVSQSGAYPARVSFERNANVDSGIRLNFPIPDQTFVIEYKGVAHQYELDLDLKDDRLERWGDLSEVLATPESMRDAMVAELDALEAVVEPLLRKRRRRDETRHARMADEMKLQRDGKRLPTLNFRESTPSATINTAEEIDQAEALILARIDRKRSFIRENYKMLFREAEKTFPIAKWLVSSSEE